LYFACAPYATKVLWWVPVICGLAGCRIGFDSTNRDNKDRDARASLEDAAEDVAEDTWLIDARPDAGPCSTAGLNCVTTVTMTTCGGLCWVYCDEAVTHATAVTRCQAWGGQLPRLESDSDVTCSLSLQTFGAWHDLVQPNGQATPGAGWIHETNGAAVTYTRWNGGQPNDGDGIEDNTEQCAYTQYPLGNWQDDPCGTISNRIVCQR
jgi:hypothetical protein